MIGLNQKGMGWLPDYPDFRDYTLRHEETNKLILPVGLEKNCSK